jgi:CRP-like cAMP-binding protein
MRRKLNQNAAALAHYFDLGRREAAAVELLLTEVTLSPGTTIIRQDAGGPRQILVLLAGTAEVLRDGERIATLGAGDLVGEITMLGYTPWTTAEVRCMTEVRALAGGTADVARLKPRGEFLTALHTIAARRRADTPVRTPVRSSL